jgi:uncharacterized membrane protein YgdD (TMEM256/DUF423 family)
MQKIILITASALGAISVMVGAFGAHALRETLQLTGKTETFETAVKYQFYHTLALFLIGIMMYRIDSKLLEYAAYSMVAGILIFSGSLYILSVSGITKWGAVTPVGGMFFIVGWILLLIAIIKM